MLTSLDHILGTRGKGFLKANLKTHAFPDSSHCTFSGTIMMVSQSVTLRKYFFN